MVARDAGARMRDESTRRVKTVVEAVGGGVAGKEGGMWWASEITVISAGGACYPDEIGAGVSNEKEALRRRAKVEGNEVLAGAGISPGGDREIGFAVEGG